MTKLVIFDMDGVLIDACDWHRIAFNQALKSTCNYEISLEDHYKEFNGSPTRVKLKKLSERGIVPEYFFDQIEELKQENTIKIINDLAVEKKEKIELIEYIKSKDIKVACYTNSIRKTAELMLKKTGVLDILDLLVTNQDVKNPKPDPEGYIKTMRHFNISAKQTIIVEDSPKGIQAAINSGASCVQVKNAEKVNISLLEDRI